MSPSSASRPTLRPSWARLATIVLVGPAIGTFAVVMLVGLLSGDFAGVMSTFPLLLVFAWWNGLPAAILASVAYYLAYPHIVSRWWRPLACAAIGGVSGGLLAGPGMQLLGAFGGAVALCAIALPWTWD